jgi:hypothetical protein
VEVVGEVTLILAQKRSRQRKLINIQRTSPLILQLRADLFWTIIPRHEFPTMGIDQQHTLWFCRRCTEGNGEKCSHAHKMYDAIQSPCHIALTLYKARVTSHQRLTRCCRLSANFPPRGSSLQLPLKQGERSTPWTRLASGLRSQQRRCGDDRVKVGPYMYIGEIVLGGLDYPRRRFARRPPSAIEEHD